MAAQLVWVVILSCFAGLVASQCQQNTFKSNASDKIYAAFKINHKKREDYTRIEVEWKPFFMVEDANCVDEDLFFLEMNHDGGEDGWTKMGEKMRPSGAGGKYKWTVDVAPCKDHYFRVWVDGDGGRAFFGLPNPVEAVSEEILKESTYKVLAPKSANAQVFNNSEVEVSFTPSECALEYQINYYKAESDQEPTSQNITKDDANTFILTEGIENCTKYLYGITASIGDKIVSEEVPGFFLTDIDSC